MSTLSTSEEVGGASTSIVNQSNAAANAMPVSKEKTNTQVDDQQMLQTENVVNVCGGGTSIVNQSNATGNAIPVTQGEDQYAG